MKKFITLLAVAAMFSFVACGPSAEQKAEQARLDSIRIADSIAEVQRIEQVKADSMAKVAAEQAHQDSIAKAAPVKK